MGSRTIVRKITPILRYWLYASKANLLTGSSHYYQGSQACLGIYWCLGTSWFLIDSTGELSEKKRPLHGQWHWCLGRSILHCMPPKVGFKRVIMKPPCQDCSVAKIVLWNIGDRPFLPCSLTPIRRLGHGLGGKDGF